jgi:hypothetical protein
MENPETGMALNQQRAGDDASAAVRSEISALRAEIASIREKLTEYSGEAYDNVARSAGTAATYVQDEASSVAGAIRQHPASAISSPRRPSSRSRPGIVATIPDSWSPGGP